MVDAAMQDWLDTNSAGEGWLRKLQNKKGLYELLGGAIIQFIKRRPQPFPFALQSKKDFWLVPSWKRGMVFVFFSRYLLGMKSQKTFDKFLMKDYKYNTRAFRRYTLHDKEIIMSCPDYVKLPDVDEHEDERPKGTKRRALQSISSPGSDSPVKRRFVVNLDSTDDDTDDEE